VDNPFVGGVALVQTLRADDLWTQFQNVIKSKVSKANWQTWLSRIDAEFEEENPVLITPSEFHLRWVQDKHGDLIASTYTEIFGPNAQPVFRVVEGAPAELPLEPPDDVAVENLPVALQTRSTKPITNLVTRYRFESFVVGQSNRFAWAAAMAVAEQPGTHYNPLFIYGGAGLGKTHLLNAVGHEALAMYPNLVVRYVSSENFLNDFIDCIRRKRPDDF
jgi:chromosomal replication initiator protein